MEEEGKGRQTIFAVRDDGAVAKEAAIGLERQLRLGILVHCHLVLLVDLDAVACAEARC